MYHVQGSICMNGTEGEKALHDAHEKGATQRLQRPSLEWGLGSWAAWGASATLYPPAPVAATATTTAASHCDPCSFFYRPSLAFSLLSFIHLPSSSSLLNSQNNTSSSILNLSISSYRRRPTTPQSRTDTLFSFCINRPRRDLQRRRNSFPSTSQTNPQPRPFQRVNTYLATHRKVTKVTSPTKL